MKRKLLLAALCVVGALGMRAQTDVTSTYLTNADFSGTYSSVYTINTNRYIFQPNGWSVDYNNKSEWNMTVVKSTDAMASNFTGDYAVPADNNKYMVRYRDSHNDEYIDLSQTITIQESGIYTFSADMIRENGSKITVALYAGETKVENSSGNVWQNRGFVVKLDKDAEVKVGVKFSNIAADGVKAGVDNIKMYAYTTNLADLTDGGTYYIRNVGNGKYWGAANNYGTRASLVERPMWVKLHKQSNGTYTMESQVNNGGTSYWFGGDYMDGGASGALPLIIYGTGTAGEYYISNGNVFNGLSLFGYDGSSTVLGKGLTDASSDNAKWEIMTGAELATDLNLAAATPTVPKDATWLIKDPNFGRNNRDESYWSGTSLSKGGDNTNMNVQAYMATFDTYQELSSIPNGVYKITAQAAVTYHDNRTVKAYDGSNPVIVYLGDGTTNSGFNEMETADQLTSQSQMSTKFTAGKYTVEPLWVKVEDGTLKIGAKSTRNDIWAVWDNFEMLYYGAAGSIAEVRLASFVAAYNAAKSEAEAFTESSMFSDDWATLQNAITNNTLDLNDPALTEEQITNATNNLVAANTAATAAVTSKTTYNNAVSTINSGTNVNLTSLIVNPSFESDLEGWTNTGGMVTQTNSSFTKTGSKYLEFWQPNGTKGVSQTVGYLPAGVYKLAVRAKARGVTSAKVFANSNEQAMTIEDKENEYTLTFEIADKTAINIGFEGVGTGAGSSWFALDNFRLTYVGTIDDLTYTLASGKMGTDKSAAQTAAETAFNNDKTLANYNALLAAIAEAEASVANYTALKAAIDKAEAVKEANNFVTAEATTALENEIATATAAWTNVTYTDADATAEIAVLGSAVSGWRGIAIEGKAGAFMASAWGKTSENWWDAPYINTWSTEGDNDGSGFSVPFFEWYVGDTENLPLNTTKTATLSNLDNGMYEVELWARVQRRTDANFGNNNEITMSVNDGAAVSIMNGASISGYEDKKAMRIGRFTARGKVTDGTLTLSIKTGGSGSNVHWLSWRDVKYTKLDEASLAVNSTVKYGTFVAPFDVDIPAGVTVYTIDEVNPKGDGSTLLATELTATIPANTPVLLKAENGYEDRTVYGKAVAAEELTEGLLTGTYEEISAPADSYVLQYLDNKAGFYQVEFGKQPKVKANRAYLNAPANAANVRGFFFSADGEATAIAGIEALTSGNYDAIYTASGVKVESLQKGLNVVVKDGKSHKIYVK